jgi:hypothetical protein
MQHLFTSMAAGREQRGALAAIFLGSAGGTGLRNSRLPVFSRAGLARR